MTFDHFAQEFAHGLAVFCDKQHEHFYGVYGQHNYDDRFSGDVEKWGRLSDLADEMEIATCDALFDRGVWQATERREAA